MFVVHKVWQLFLTTHKFTTALAFLYCGCSALAHGWCLHYANDAGLHNSMQHCTGCCTKLYAVRACCTVCNTHAERSCEGMAEWVMFEADLWNADSLSSANFFRFRDCITIGVQQDSFPAPVPSGKAIFALQKNSKVSSSSARRCIHL